MPVTVTFPTPSGAHEEIWGFDYEDDFGSLALVCLGSLMRIFSLADLVFRLISPITRGRGSISILPTTF